MLRQDGIPPISRNKPRRGNMRGAISSDDESRPRGRDKRSVHFEEQQTKTSAPARGGTRGGRGLPAHRGSTATSRASSAAKEPAKRAGFTQQIANHIQGQPSGRRNIPPTGDHAAYQEKFNQLKKSRERERTAAIANGTFADPNKRVTLAEAITPVGTCRDMCPEFERVRRTVQRDVWPEERDESKPDPGPMSRLPDESRMVKKFTRSAAGQEEQLPSDLRPPEVLKLTIDYLFDTLISNAPRLADVHHFVWDRTRAIRNDFSIQQVSKNDDVRIAMDSYERIARFHILSMHILAEKESQYTEYNAQQEREQLDKTILSLVDYYEDNKDRIQSPNEAEFRAYQILFQIQSPRPNLEDRLQDWSKRVQQDPRVHTALRIYTAACSIANPQGPMKPYTSHKIAQSHWGSFWHLVSSPEVSYLMGCVSEIYFPMLRRKALHSLWQAYRPRAGRAPSSEWTLDEVRPVLGMQTDDEVADYCEQCGLKIKEHADGSATLDLGSVIGGPSDIGNSQVFTKLVDDKREGRSLSAVMNGMNVRQARAASLLQGTDYHKGIEDKTQQVQKKNTDDDSLFVPENGSSSQQGSTKQQSPWASSNQSAFASNTSPFSRPKTTDAPPHQTWSPETGIKFGSSTSKSPFAPSNNAANQAQPPHVPAQPVFAPSLSSTSSPFGVPANFGLPKHDQATSTVLGNASKSLLDRTPDSGSTPNAPASSTLSSQPSLFHNPGTPSEISGSSNPFNPASSFPAPSKITPNASSLSSAQPTPNVAGQHPGSATQTTRQANSNSLFTNADQQKSSDISPQLSSNQQPPSTLFTNALNQKPSSDSQAPLQPVSVSLASDQEAIARQAAEQQAKAEDEKRAAETEQRRRHAEKREAEEQEQRAKQLAAHVAAQRKAQREKTLDDLTRSLLLGPNGFLSQYIEYNVGPLIEATQNQVQHERVMREADQFRVSHILGRYGRKWRDICWKRRLARQGRERRQRQQRDAEARRRREQNTNISAEMEAFRNSADSNKTSPAASTHRRLSNERQQSQTNRILGGRGPSASREPDLASSSAYTNRRASYTKDRDSAAEFSADRSLQSTRRSSRSVFATPRQPELRAQRKDTTRSDYFRLKVMGIQPPPDTLPPAKPASGYRATGLKRLRESDSYLDLHRSAGSSVASRGLNASTTQNSMPPPSKRPASQVEVETNVKSSTSTASSLDQQDEDDALLEQVRQAQEAMRESIDFFRGEMDEMKRESTRTSRSNSVDNQGRALARVGLESASRSRGRTRSDADKVSTQFDGAQFTRAAAPPPKYRSRVSKFLPREEYADMRMLRDGHYGASPRPSSKLKPSARAPSKSPESAQVFPAADSKPSSPYQHDKTQAQSREKVPSPRAPQVNGTNDAPPASLASSQSHHPSKTFPPGATLGTLIKNSTEPSTSSPAFSTTPASTSFGFASRLTPNGDYSNQNKTTNASALTSFNSESSAFQPAASSSFSIRPEMPQVAPQPSSPLITPKNPTLGVPAQNGANGQTQQTFQAQETIVYPTLPSSSPGPETGTQRQERLLGTAGKGTRDATPISPPRLSQRRKRELDDDNDDETTVAPGKAQGQAWGPFIAQNTVTLKRQKREKRIANQRANAFALLADRTDDDDDEGQGSGSSRGDDHDNMMGDGAVKESVDAGPTKGFEHENLDARGSDAPSLLHPGQGNDFGTPSLDGNSHGDSDGSDNDNGDESEDGSIDDEQGFDDDEEGRRPDFGDEEDEVQDNVSSVSSSGEDDDDDSSDSRRDANIYSHTIRMPASRPARDFGGKTGASVEDAIEL